MRSPRSTTVGCPALGHAIGVLVRRRRPRPPPGASSRVPAVSGCRRHEPLLERRQRAGEQLFVGEAPRDLQALLEPRDLELARVATPSARPTVARLEGLAAGQRVDVEHGARRADAVVDVLKRLRRLGMAASERSSAATGVDGRPSRRPQGEPLGLDRSSPPPRASRTRRRIATDPRLRWPVALGAVVQRRRGSAAPRACRSGCRGYGATVRDAAVPRRPPASRGTRPPSAA